MLTPAPPLAWELAQLFPFFLPSLAVIFLGGPITLTVTAGTGSFKLEVEMSGGRVSWFKDGIEVKEDKSRIWELHGHGQGEMSSLRVHQCKQEDAGTYLAKTTTDAGSCISSACLVNVVEKDKGNIMKKKES